MATDPDQDDHTIKMNPSPNPHFNVNWLEPDLLGRITKHWMHHMTLYFSHCDPVEFYAHVLTIIWEGVFKLWESRNNDNSTAHECFQPLMLSSITDTFAACKQ